MDINKIDNMAIDATAEKLLTDSRYKTFFEKNGYKLALHKGRGAFVALPQEKADELKFSSLDRNTEIVIEDNVIKFHTTLETPDFNVDKILKVNLFEREPQGLVIYKGVPYLFIPCKFLPIKSIEFESWPGAGFYIINGKHRFEFQAPVEWIHTDYIEIIADPCHIGGEPSYCRLGKEAVDLIKSARRPGVLAGKEEFIWEE